MNRKQKRNFVKAAKKKGVDKRIADVYLRLKEMDVSPVDLEDGDKVRLNLKAIQGHADYDRLSEQYKQFVENNTEQIFTVSRDERGGKLKTVVSLKEEPTWLFWTSDLIKVEE